MQELELDTLRDEFNRLSPFVRVVAILSPT